MMWAPSTLPAKPGPLPSARYSSSDISPHPAGARTTEAPPSAAGTSTGCWPAPPQHSRLTSSIPWGNGLSTQSFSGKRCRIWPWPSPLPEDRSRWSEHPPLPTPTQAGAARVSNSHLAAPGGNVPTPTLIWR